MESMGSERRTRHAERRRQDILQAAARVFASKGFEKATTREIALEADVAEGTIYNYFASKQQLLLDLAQMLQEQLAAVVPEPRAAGDLRAAISGAVEQVLQIVVENAIVVRGLFTAVWDRGYGFQGYMLPGAHKLVARVEEFLQDRVEAGAIRPCDVHSVARMVMGMVIYLAAPYVQGIEPLPTPEQRRQQAQLLVSILVDGLKA